MGRAATYKAGGGGGERRRRADLPFRRPSGANADGAATQRNVIPWKEMEVELAKRLAARAARGELDDPLTGPPRPPGPPVPMPSAQKPEDDAGEALAKGAEREIAVEPAPDSGVRSSQDAPVLSSATRDAGTMRPLTYSMYTISDLDAGGAQPVRTAPAPTAPKPVVRWADLGRSMTGLSRAFAGWARLPKPRPRVLDVCRPALEKFGSEARAAAAAAWSSGLARRLAIGFAIGFGSLLVLAVVVMMVADLTDDVKPTHGTTYASHAVVPGEAAPARAGDTAPPPVIELGDLDEEPSAKTKAKPVPPSPPAPPKPSSGVPVAPKAKHETKKPAVAERFIP